MTAPAKLLKQRERAIKKRDKWQQRVNALEKTLRSLLHVSPAAANSVSMPTVPEVDAIRFIQGPNLAQRVKIDSSGSYHGIFVHVASALGLHPETVRAVDRSSEGSDYVRKTIAAFRTSALRLKGQDPNKAAGPNKPTRGWLAPKEKFQRGGIYYGLRQRVAKELGIRDSSVRDAASGRRSMPRVAAVLKQHMDRIDAEIALEREAKHG